MRSQAGARLIGRAGAHVGAGRVNASQLVRVILVLRLLEQLVDVAPVLTAAADAAVVAAAGVVLTRDHLVHRPRQRLCRTLRRSVNIHRSLNITNQI